MIDHLDISDLGVIAHASLPLGPGFTVLTGETGAGKTMVVTALGLLLGDRADTARVRQGSDASWIEGHFRVGSSPEVLTRVEEFGGAIDDGSLVVSRQVAGEGRSRAIVGGRSVPLTVLQEIGEQLVVVHGQSDQIRLRSESAQRDALDRFAGGDLQRILARYSQLFAEHASRVARLRELESDQEARAAEAQRLSDALAEIEAVRPLAGEDEHLRTVSERLENVEELRQAAAQAKQALSLDSVGDGLDARSLVDGALRSLERVSGSDQTLDPIVANLREGLVQLEEASRALSVYLNDITDGGSVDLESVMQRRADITALIRTYGPTLDDVLAFEKNASDRLLELDLSGESRGALEDDVRAGQEELDRLAREISQARSAAARTLEEAVTTELNALAMPDAQFIVEVSPKEPSQSGADHIAFLLAPHKGAPPRPLQKGASGGELSRVMLALEVVIAEADPVPTFIFDEVDSGVGGQTALEIGRRLARLSQKAQVICVTHLAQVASCADRHLQVVKDSSGEFTQSSVRVLTGEDRLGEIARMLGGDQDSGSARAHAREMLERESVSRDGH